MKRIKNRIMLSGGGTGGSVTPLIALAEELKRQDETLEFLWVGTKKGVEFTIVEEAAIPFFGISSGKLRRYFSFRNFTDLILIIIGFCQSVILLWRWQPSVLISAGSFVAVPLTWAAWLMRIPVLVHQMDITPGLANKLMAPFAKVVTVTFRQSLDDYGSKAKLIGSPVRSEIKKVHLLDRQNAIQRFGFKNDLPIILVVGGGTGAEAVNKIVIDALPELTMHARVIHQTGLSKSMAENNPRYRAFEFLDSTTLTEAFAACDLVISRSGIGFITEICFLGKPMILIPMPNSHQEENARVLAESDSAIVLRQNELTGDVFTKVVLKLLSDKQLMQVIGDNAKKVLPDNAEAEMAKIVQEIMANI